MSKGTYSHSNRQRMHEPQVTNYDEVAHLKGVIAELKKDKERLDWLVGSGFLTHRIRQSGATPTREDIDIAMNSQEP